MRIKRCGNVLLDTGIEGRCGVIEGGLKVFGLRAREVEGEVRVQGGDEGDVDFNRECELVASEDVGVNGRKVSCLPGEDVARSR